MLHKHRSASCIPTNSAAPPPNNPHTHTQTSVLLFFGYMGSIIFVCGAALGLVALLAGAGLGTLTWPVFWAIVAKGLLDNVLSDYLWARAILLIGENREGDIGICSIIRSGRKIGPVTEYLLNVPWHPEEGSHETGMPCQCKAKACQIVSDPPTVLLTSSCHPGPCQAPPWRRRGCPSRSHWP